MIRPLLLLFAGAFWFTSCVEVRNGPMEHESRVIPRDASKSLRVDLRMGAGTLRVSGGSDKLLAGDFSYNVREWKPDIRYNSNETRGTLSIEQPGRHHTTIGRTRYEWNLRLNDEVPTDLNVNFGAGEATLDVGSLYLRVVDVNMGVGQLVLDLRGAPRHDYEVHIQGGVGEATVRLPATVGVSARGSGGIGSISVRGLHKEGSRWINDAYDSSKVQIRVDVSGGIGAINLIAE
jgi:hypothetical protein